jgi:uncharacterized membrane protein SirB2
MQILILLHVLSAIIGVGPTFFGHVLLRKNQSAGELKHSLRMTKLLEYFPKIGGTIAVVTGIILVALQDHVEFKHLWIIASLVLYVLIQIVVVGFGAPLGKQLHAWAAATDLPDSGTVPAEQSQVLAKYERLYFIASAMGVLIFILMVVKEIPFVQ